MNQQNAELFETVYDATFPGLRRMALLRARSVSDAEDLLQNVYLAFYRQLEKRGGSGIENPEAYLKTILKSELKKYYRFKAKTEDALPEENVLPSEEDAEERALFRLRVEDVWQKVKEEPPLSEKLFLLRYGYDMSTKEIAGQLGLTDEAVRTRLSRTRKNLIKKIGDTEE